MEIIESIERNDKIKAIVARWSAVIRGEQYHHMEFHLPEYTIPFSQFIKDGRVTAKAKFDSILKSVSVE